MQLSLFVSFFAQCASDGRLLLDFCGKLLKLFILETLLNPSAEGMEVCVCVVIVVSW